jgi:hypothetical protein
MYILVKFNQPCEQKPMMEKIVIPCGLFWKVEGQTEEVCWMRFVNCKGGRDGGCKHISAAMYSLEALLNPDGDKSVTSGPCLWMPKPQSGSEPCSVDQLLITKSKPPYI